MCMRDGHRSLRIDVVVATTKLHAMLKEADVDYELEGIEKPSDQAPILSVFKYQGKQ